MATEKWFKALGMLFEACEPLTYDSRLSAQQIKELHHNIGNHTFYCAHVKNCIEDGVEPLSWEDWLDNTKRMRFEGDAFIEKMEKIKPTEKLEPINVQEFKDDLVKAFGEDYREYASKTPKKKNTGFIARSSNKDAGDDVRLGARFYGGHED